ncbi:MAG: hypothetical protein EOR30_25295 [Mesorhizobium sp.]|nr:MAG: hypothetical protein EOR14_23865 [Mesorhizobium sp.]RWI64175.1 MAG: hypothetical protein EOR17_25705 [Mesorhizobium sp.]RWI83099.1 MAG: hypothetical protein EOR20_24390 [Mesorhizobium sp.]RWJ46820.1 MAG: hypothetical protein EOR30_25295 [Mesorhizobium sp.]RWJ58821.1 MAG: hypothetical protein EOR32_23715 [Mesorhizobium sp.]
MNGDGGSQQRLVKPCLSSILYSLFSILYSLFSILYSLFTIHHSPFIIHGSPPSLWAVTKLTSIRHRRFMALR